jgi:hypothetical protein
MPVRLINKFFIYFAQGTRLLQTKMPHHMMWHFCSQSLVARTLCLGGLPRARYNSLGIVPSRVDMGILKSRVVKVNTQVSMRRVTWYLEDNLLVTRNDYRSISCLFGAPTEMQCCLS